MMTRRDVDLEGVQTTYRYIALEPCGPASLGTDKLNSRHSFQSFAFVQELRSLELQKMDKRKLCACL